MVILVTGANGFLGQELCQQLIERGHTVIATGKGPCRLSISKEIKSYHYAELDFTDPFAVHDVFEKFLPEVVIHAGAMTQVDRCEKEQWNCFIVNVEGTVTMLLNAAAQRSFFIFVSTDFVFDGIKGSYDESDTPAPVNYYGRTKLEGEEAVMEYEQEWAIVRTSLVYGRPMQSRGNIVTVIRDHLLAGEPYRVVDDQWRSPTFVGDLAAGIVSIVEKRATGIYHLSGNETLTPFEIAMRIAAHAGLDASRIERVTAATFSQEARRPVRTNLVLTKAREQLGYMPRSFADGLAATLNV